jgi:hypothetical protein
MNICFCVNFLTNPTWPTKKTSAAYAPELVDEGIVKRFEKDRDRKADPNRESQITRSIVEEFFFVRAWRDCTYDSGFQRHELPFERKRRAAKGLRGFPGGRKRGAKGEHAIAPLLRMTACQSSGSFSFGHILDMGLSNHHLLVRQGASRWESGA